MTPVLVDSNVIHDLVEHDPRWLGWSMAALARLANETVLVINPIIYAEVAIGFDGPGDLEAVLPADGYRREPLPCEAAFAAGKAFLAYRRRAASAAHLCRTSISVRMRRSAARDC